jgi:sugar/nucleoside kinase (ribokinase family)
MNLIAIGENVCDIYIPEGTMHPGGQCANTAVYAGMLGMEASYLGQFGSDLPGKIMQEALSSYGVDISHCRVIEGENGYCRIEHRNKDRIFAGSNLFGVMRTHPMRLSEKDWEYIRCADVIYTDINSQMLSYLPQLWETKIPVAFDFSAKVQDEDLIRIAPYVTIASLSLAHLPAKVRLRKMKLMQEQGTSYVLGTIGKEGSMLLYQEKLYREPASDTATVVDTLGAGDAYFTALLKELFGSGKSIQTAMHEAAAFAAQVIGWEGAYPFPRNGENYD